MNKELTILAKTENMSAVTDFITTHMEEAGVPAKYIYAVNIAADEIFSNIAKYAYNPGTGDVNVRLEMDEESVRLTFTDTGVPFDPHEMTDPDTTQSAQDRDIGGLGIFMVRKLMDKTEYRHENGQNIMTVFKKISV